MLVVGIPKETRELEARVAATPDSVKKLMKRKGVEVRIEQGSGASAGFSDPDMSQSGAKIVSASEAFQSDIVLKIQKPTMEEIAKLKKGAVLLSLLEPYLADGTMEALAKAGVSAVGMELIPRTTRAQSMDVLSSQANIAGYRAALEAATHYGRFCPMMMTSAGSSKPAKVLVLGAGVAGLQAIATARKLGSVVEAFDVRAEVKEQILSLGAKFVEIDLGEEGSGSGGYAKELSEAAKKKQIAALTEKIQKMDIVISTANIPGRKAPTLVTAEAVRGMRTGSVIVDMAAQSGGNCELTEKDKVVKKHGVTVVGLTHYPSLLATDSSAYFANNHLNLMALFLKEKDGATVVEWDLKDDILDAALATHENQVRFGRKS